MDRKRANRATMEVIATKTRSKKRPRDVQIWGHIDEPTSELHVRCWGEWVLWHVGDNDECCQRALSILRRTSSGITDFHFLERVEPVVDQRRRRLLAELAGLALVGKLLEHLKVATKDQPAKTRLTVRRYREARRALVEWRSQIEDALAVERNIPPAVSPTIKELHSTNLLPLRAHVPVHVKRSRLTKAARRRAYNAKNAAKAARIRMRELKGATG